MSASEKKNCYIGVRLSETERRRLQALVVTSGLGSISAVVTTLIAQADGILPARVVPRPSRAKEQRAEVAHGV